MTRYPGLRCTIVPILALAGAQLLSAADFRPPAVPLVTHDPYFSVWSMADRLTDESTKHWTGTPQALGALARVDGKTFRLMGKELDAPPAMTQTRLEVWPTRTIYEFADSGVAISLTFLTPTLPDDLEVLSRPVTYVVWRARATDGREHAV